MAEMKEGTPVEAEARKYLVVSSQLFDLERERVIITCKNRAFFSLSQIIMLLLLFCTLELVVKKIFD